MKLVLKAVSTSDGTVKHLRISPGASFKDLHGLIGEVFNISEKHAHEFRLEGITIVERIESIFEDFDTLKEDVIKLREFFKEIGDVAVYVYDFLDEKFIEITLVGFE